MLASTLMRGVSRPSPSVRLLLLLLQLLPLWLLLWLPVTMPLGVLPLSSAVSLSLPGLRGGTQSFREGLLGQIPGRWPSSFGFRF